MSCTAVTWRRVWVTEDGEGMEREDEGTVSMGGDGQGTARGLTRKRSTPTWGAWAVGRHALALQRSLVGVQLAVGVRAQFQGD